MGFSLPTGGWGLFTQSSVSLHPAPALEVRLTPAYNRTHAVSQYVRSVTDPTALRTYGARYVFSELDQTTVSMDTRVSWAFTPHLSLQLYAQPFIAVGDYSGFKELHAARQGVFDVYGEGGSTLTETAEGYRADPDGSGEAPSFVIWNADFNVRSLRGNAVLRWEYRPGSTLYLVWQQRRFDRGPGSEFRLGEDVDALAHLRPENVFALKVSY